MHILVPSFMCTPLNPINQPIELPKHCFSCQTEIMLVVKTKDKLKTTIFKFNTLEVRMIEFRRRYI